MCRPEDTYSAHWCALLLHPCRYGAAGRPVQQFYGAQDGNTGTLADLQGAADVARGDHVRPQLLEMAHLAIAEPVGDSGLKCRPGSLRTVTSVNHRQQTLGAPRGGAHYTSMTGHGPDAATFAKASHADTGKAEYITDTMAIMFESRAVIRPLDQALELAERQCDYGECWRSLTKHFRETA